MGIVYRATDRRTGNVVALKQVTTSGYEDAETYRLALAREFQTLAGLRHPHIISVLDYGFDQEKQPFFTMAYLPQKQNILEAAKNKSLSHKVELIHQLLQALSYLHRRGVLHCDLKPDNVLVLNDQVRLLDFGLSTHERFTSSSIGGSLPYSAPELFEGGSLSQSADLYAVGVLFYQMVKGEHPFAPFDYTFVNRVVSKEPDLIHLDERAKPFLEKLLNKKPEGRFTSASTALKFLTQSVDLQLPVETHATRESFLQAATFIGREFELEQLQNALSETKIEGSAVWLLGGESGVGKSRLLEEIQTHALVDGWQVWRGQAVESGQLPYQLWREIVPNIALNIDLSEIEASILKQIYPQIDSLLDQHIPTIASSTNSDDQERLVLTLVETIKRQAHPTLILLEDLQWARESLAPLSQMLQLSNLLQNVLVIGTYRSDESPTIPDELSGAKSLQLNRLTEPEIQQLSQAMLGEQASNTEIQSLLTQETEGNTFFIVEVIRTLAEEAGDLNEVGQMNLPAEILTSGMESLVHRRTEKISPDDQPLLQLAAVAGRQIDTALLKQLDPAQNVSRWLQRGQDAALLIFRDGQWQFSHDKFR
ncbi:MAG: AAA family ATPase, partial [Chloroflexota bacterium]